MEAYSLDLRERIVRACACDFETREGIAETHGVSRSFVQKLWRRWQESESIAAKAGGRGPSPSLGDRQWVRAIRRIVRSDSDATLNELCVALVEAGGPDVSRSTMCRTLTAMGLPLKKSPFTRANGTRPA
jgi:transposase